MAFNEIRGIAKKTAIAQVNTVRNTYNAIMATGAIPHEQAREIVISSLPDSPYRDEVIDIVFYPSRQWNREYNRRQERANRRYESRRQRSRDWWDNYYRQQNSNGNHGGYNQSSGNAYSGLATALAFFGFSAMPGLDELKKRYRELALQLHPDKGGSTAKFQEFQNHKELLFRRAGL